VVLPLESRNTGAKDVASATCRRKYGHGMPAGGYPLASIICGIVTDSIEEAIEAGWIPYFYEGEHQREPACRECSETLLRIDEKGEMEVKEEYLGEDKIPFWKRARRRVRQQLGYRNSAQ
jgi:hypothetical protein